MATNPTSIESLRQGGAHRKQPGSNLPENQHTWSPIHSKTQNAVPMAIVCRRAHMETTRLQTRGLGKKNPQTQQNHRNGNCMCGNPTRMSNSVPEAADCISKPLTIDALTTGTCTSYRQRCILGSGRTKLRGPRTRKTNPENPLNVATYYAPATKPHRTEPHSYRTE